MPRLSAGQHPFEGELRWREPVEQRAAQRQATVQGPDPRSSSALSAGVLSRALQRWAHIASRRTGLQVLPRVRQLRASEGQAGAARAPQPARAALRAPANGSAPAARRAMAWIVTLWLRPSSRREFPRRKAWSARSRSGLMMQSDSWSCA